MLQPNTKGSMNQMDSLHYIYLNLNHGLLIKASFVCFNKCKENYLKCFHFLKRSKHLWVQEIQDNIISHNHNIQIHFNLKDTFRWLIKINLIIISKQAHNNSLQLQIIMDHSHMEELNVKITLTMNNRWQLESNKKQNLFSKNF